jgi:hypothetical protein
MSGALRVVQLSLRGLWDELVLLALMNLLWSLCALLPTVPLFALPGLDLPPRLGLSLLLAVPLPIMSAGLCFVANQISRERAVGWHTLAEGLRRYWAKSLGVTLINLLVLVTIAANFQFYAVVLEGQEPWALLAFAAWLLLVVYWSLVQVFWFPMILELTSEKIFLALRSALAMVVVTPLFSLTLGVLLVLITLLCLALTLPALLILASLFFLVANHATRSRLAFARKEPYPPPPERG